MNRLASALAATEALLPARRFAVVGGIAVSARTEPRFTRDLDLAVSRSGRRLSQAREGIRLITERGFDRGRDLAAALDKAVASSPG